jgi:probable F420-dependent oxidoreductase
MKFAIPLSMLPIEEIQPLGIAADQIGYDYVAVSDHLIHPETFSVPYPYTEDGSVRWEPGTDWPDPINTLSLLAGATKNIQFYTSVYVLPARNPMRVAKEIATLSVLSGGRFDLGIGMGWMPEEFEAGGQEFRKRGKRADEMIEVMKLLWTGGMVSFDGEFFQFDTLEMLPAPKNDIPIFVGGFSEPALNRAANHDGWISDMHSLKELKVLIDNIEDKRAKAGKKNDYEHICFSCWDAFSLEGFTKMKELGVTTMTTYPWMLYGVMNDAPLAEKIDGMERFFKEVVCKLR